LFQKSTSVNVAGDYPKEERLRQDTLKTVARAVLPFCKAIKMALWFYV
jgi:hypothetical protein